MSSEFGGTIAFGVLALLLFLIGKRIGFFEFSPQEWRVPIRLVHVIGAFAIYFLASFFLAKFLVIVLKKQIMLHFMAYSSLLNFAISFVVLIFLGIYFKSLPSLLTMGILRRGPQKPSIIDDIWAALTSWIMAFPLVLFFSQLLEWILMKVFHLTLLPEQIAVRFLKSSFESPLYFILAFLSIVVLAPLIEETLFRGFLQSYIRQHLGSRQAILITSVCFSLFHYSAGQGIGNISIILSLFLLALFLGFLYEKRGSLLAPMILHGTFNLVSVVNLYLFGGFSSGL